MHVKEILVNIGIFIKEKFFNLCVFTHDDSEVVIGIASYHLLMRVDISDELGHLAFSLGGSCISGALVWFIKKSLDKHSDKIFRWLRSVFKKKDNSLNRKNKKG